MKRTSIITIALCFIITALLSACSESSPAPTPTPTAAVTPEPTPTPVPDRMGAYLDNIYMFQTIPSQAAQQVLDGTLDIYAGGLRADQLEALDKSEIQYESSVKRQYELLLNPADTKETAGKVNPLSFTEVRSALNLVFDRNYIAEEIFSGGAVPKFQPLVYKSGDYTKNEAAIKVLSEKYKYDFETAEAVITEALQKNGFEKNEEGKWAYKNEPAAIIILIRNDDDLRTAIGDYAVEQFEKLGFTVEAQYVSLSEANTLWAAGNPAEGLWHVYTGRRTLDTAPLNQESAFADYYTNLGESGDIELYNHFVPGEDFTQKAAALINGEYDSMEQRQEYMSALVSECNDYSYRIWLVDELAYYPYSTKMEFANRMTSRADTDYATVYSFKSTDIRGGDAAWGSAALLESYVNPVNGSAEPSEAQFLNFTNIPLIYMDSDAGGKTPVFIKSAAITYQSEISYVNDADWITADTADEIAVPNDAIISWDPKDGSAIYADTDYMHDAVGLATAWLATYEREKPKDRDKIQRQEEIIQGLQAIEDRGYLTCNIKYVVEYDESIFDLKWHDCSDFSIADIIMAFITKTQLMDEDSPLYDEYFAQQHAGELDGFKGFRVVSEYPLVIEYYTDSYSHLASETVKPFWVDYGTGQQSWAEAAAANEAVTQKAASYSEGLSSYYGYALLDYVKGTEGLTALANQLNRLETSSYIPYEELLSPYVTKEKAKEQYQSILDFYGQYKHMYIGMGPYMITGVDPLTPSLALSAFPDFAIKADDMAKKFK